MNFLSAAFLAFFPVCLFCYYIFPKKAQNAVLLAANCAFYLWAGPAMGLWLAGEILISYFCALAVERGVRRLWTAVGALALLGALLVCKLPPLRGALSSALILPLGIAFYSLSLTGYLFDVYRGKCPAEHDLLRFAAFASFFPCVLGGPISRARELLPQLEQPRRFGLEGFKAGLWRFLRGAGKKLVLAALLAGVVDPAYAAPEEFGPGLWLLVFCAGPVVLWAEFSSYCDLSLGAARMLGLDLEENFRAPFLARTGRELWGRWQITLTSWLEEYLLVPLGGEGSVRRGLVLILACAAGGLWYGAGARLLALGLLAGVWLAAGYWTLPARTRLREKLRIPENAWYMAAFQTLFTFALFAAGCVLLRAASVGQALFIFRRVLLIFRDGPGEVAAALSLRKGVVLLACLLLSALGGLLGEKAPRLERTSFRFWLCAAVLAAAVLLFGQYGPDAPAIDFLYFHI